MSDRQILLSEDVYIELLAVADNLGITPEVWIANQINHVTTTTKNKDDQWQQLQKAFGTWENDSELDQIFTEIDQRRHDYRGRELDSESFD